MAVDQITAHVHKDADAEVRGLAIAEEATTEVNIGAVAGLLTTVVENIGLVKRTVLTFAARELTVTDVLAYAGTKIYDFPAKKVLLLAASASLQFAVQGANTTINDSAAMDYSVGTVTAASTTLDSTEADIVPKVDAPLSATNGALSTAAVGDLAASAFLASAADVYLNVAFPTATEIDADGVLEITGTITLTWIETN
ncbi:hypothetical protein [Caudoviricetes sp.]|nr:hypothetical protein [Caudoviricetes sp.]